MLIAVIIIFGTGIILCLLLIWRAIIGKSTIDYHLAEQIKRNTKALTDNVTVDKQQVDAVQKLEKSMTDAKRALSDLGVSITKFGEKVYKDVENGTTTNIN